jgi:hypothetical protein
MKASHRSGAASPPGQRLAKSQIPVRSPDGNGEIRTRERLPSGEPVPEVITTARGRAAAITRDTLPVPRGAVRVLGRLLVLSHGNPTEAAVVARHWAGGTDDPRFALLAGILDEIAADCATLPTAGAVPA